jgi:hypothetical protein
VDTKIFNPLTMLSDVADAARKYAIAGAQKYVATEAGQLHNELSASAAANIQKGDTAAFAARSKLGGIPIPKNTVYIVGGIGALVILVLIFRK